MSVSKPCLRPASVCLAQAGVLHLGLGGRDGWAGCIPVFFAELGMGFSDIQAFTEHCFTIAGTKRENRSYCPGHTHAGQLLGHVLPGHTEQALQAWTANPRPL